MCSVGCLGIIRVSVVSSSSSSMIVADELVRTNGKNSFILFKCLVFFFVVVLIKTG